MFAPRLHAAVAVAVRFFYVLYAFFVHYCRCLHFFYPTVRLSER